MLRLFWSMGACTLFYFYMECRSDKITGWVGMETEFWSILWYTMSTVLPPLAILGWVIPSWGSYCSRMLNKPHLTALVYCNNQPSVNTDCHLVKPAPLNYMYHMQTKKPPPPPPPNIHSHVWTPSSPDTRRDEWELHGCWLQRCPAENNGSYASPLCRECSQIFSFPR